MSAPYKTDLQFIAQQAPVKEEENDELLHWLKGADAAATDALVHDINNTVSAAINCTDCGNCCKTLIINVAPGETRPVAQFLNISEQEVDEKYIEHSMAGNTFINAIPCHFLKENKCSIYTARFHECREFPHLHKPGFYKRLSGTLMHYAGCPIIYNVIEEFKVRSGFAAR
jgi:Fe-S-cluster containining protein